MANLHSMATAMAHMTCVRVCVCALMSACACLWGEKTHKRKAGRKQEQKTSEGIKKGSPGRWRDARMSGSERVRFPLLLPSISTLSPSPPLCQSHALLPAHDLDLSLSLYTSMALYNRLQVWPHSRSDRSTWGTFNLSHTCPIMRESVPFL